MAYLKVLIAAITALWSIFFFVYTMPFAADPSQKQAICKHTSHYSLSCYTAFEESTGEECKKADSQKNADQADIFLQVEGSKFRAASIACAPLPQTQALYLLHRRLLI